MPDDENYQFTNNWFEDTARNVWDHLVPQVNPTRILEVGSYEGASTCYLIDKLASRGKLELHCIDTWEGGVEHRVGGVAEMEMTSVEERFLHNTGIAARRAAENLDLHVHKGYSDIQLARLLANGKANYFDFIYIDGSHQAPDVLCDAVLCFRLLREGGVIAFDDYLWAEDTPDEIDPIRCPKPAIDAFTNIYCRKTSIIPAPLSQLYVQKISS